MPSCHPIQHLTPEKRHVSSEMLSTSTLMSKGGLPSFLLFFSMVFVTCPNIFADPLVIKNHGSLPIFDPHFRSDFAKGQTQHPTGACTHEDRVSTDELQKLGARLHLKRAPMLDQGHGRHGWLQYGYMAAIVIGFFCENNFSWAILKKWTLCSKAQWWNFPTANLHKPHPGGWHHFSWKKTTGDSGSHAQLCVVVDLAMTIWEIKQSEIEKSTFVITIYNNHLSAGWFEALCSMCFFTGQRLTTLQLWTAVPRWSTQLFDVDHIGWNLDDLTKRTTRWWRTTMVLKSCFTGWKKIRVYI